VLIFDIFGKGGQGADPKVGPTKIVKKEVDTLNNIYIIVIIIIIIFFF